MGKIIMTIIIMEVIGLNFRYCGTICSDLNMIKNFVDKVLGKIDNVVQDNDIMFDIKLILNELIINGVMHGNDCEATKCVTLSLELKDNKITIQVEDEGDGVDFDIDSYNPKELKCCGRGLVIVNGLSDEFYIQRNKVIAIKNIN